MNFRRATLRITTTAMAVLSLTLAACGGGSGEAPPAIPAAVVVPAAPVVTITNNVAAETATGDIVFTFSFNRDVGTSFTADDVTVTGGDKGAFARTSGTAATLVVSPPANSTGTVVITVPDGAVTDAGGAANVAVTAQKAFDTTVPPPPPPTGGTVTFSTGFAAGNRTAEGGEFGGFSGSNLDGYNCNGDPANCGSGGEFVPAQAAADSYFFYYHQTPTPAADLYMGIYVQAPGVTGGFSPSADTPGVQLTTQTMLKFKLGQNAEWFGSTTNNFMIVMDLGKRYDVSGNTCRLQLRRVVTPTAAAATDYEIALDSFALVQDCAGAVTSVAQALAASPISQISFQGVGGGIALSDGTRTSGANLSVPNGAGVYPTTLVLVGGISFTSPPAALEFSTGFAGSNRTVEGGEFGGFSGSNLDGYNCNGDPANCGSGGEFVPAQAAADSYFFYYYQTPTPAADLYMGIYVQAPGVTGGFSPTADTPGVQVTTQTTLRFKLGQNAEWFGGATNNFMIVMDLGKRYDVSGNTCRLQLRRVVTPTDAAASDYAIPLDSFMLAQDCAGAVTSVAQALAASPISQIAFQGVGGGIALSDGTRTSGANLSVPNGAGVYPTTLVLVGGITID
ncbi:MAG: hypothetical protein KF863_07305 [Rubrivivax sp.]|nr:hypothetical protein [Rubrivivax sp.]